MTPSCSRSDCLGAPGLARATEPRATTDGGSTWGAWGKAIVGTFKGAPAVVASGPQRLDLIVFGTDDNYGHAFLGRLMACLVSSWQTECESSR